MAAKTSQLQIRVTPAQKAALKREARAAGCDVSTLVLTRALPSPDGRLPALLRALSDAEAPGYVLAEIHDLLADTAAFEFQAAVGGVTTDDLDRLDAFHRNYVAAMVEHAASVRSVAAPEWVRTVDPLPEPYFAVPWRSLRLHLLAHAPVPYKRRNLFVDAGIGARV